MTTETTWRDEFDLVLKTIVLPGEFDILDETDRSRWLGALQQAYDAGRNKAEKYKEDAERYRWLRDTNLDAGVRATGEHLEPLQVPMIFIGHPEDQWTLGSFASAWVGEKFDRAIDAAIDKARKTT